jgi:hypothetical protein
MRDRMPHAGIRAGLAPIPTNLKENRMRKLLILLACTAIAGPAAAQAAPEKKPNALVLKRQACNDQAGARQGDERRAFVKTCMAKPSERQARLKQCKVDAGDRKGAERSAFVKACAARKA